MKSPQTCVYPASMIIWGFHMTNKNSPDTSGRTKNEHMKSPRTGVHPAPMTIWGFHVTIKKQ